MLVVTDHFVTQSHAKNFILIDFIFFVHRDELPVKNVGKNGVIKSLQSMRAIVLCSILSVTRRFYILLSATLLSFSLKLWISYFLALKR